MDLRPQRSRGRRGWIGPRQSARVGHLKTDDRALAADPALRVAVEDLLTQRFEPGHTVVEAPSVDEELIRVGAALRGHRHRLPAPDQLRAAQPEASPAPPRQFARAAVPLPVPTLHRMDRKPVASLPAEDRQRPRQRPARSEQFVRAVERPVEAAQMLPKGRGGPMVARRRVASGQRAGPGEEGRHPLRPIENSRGRRKIIRYQIAVSSRRCEGSIVELWRQSQTSKRILTGTISKGCLWNWEPRSKNGQVPGHAPGSPTGLAQSYTGPTLRTGRGGRRFGRFATC